ncbi:MAG: hypothetical protein AAF565_11060 [Pseudomonadota bacterium]
MNPQQFGTRLAEAIGLRGKDQLPRRKAKPAGFSEEALKKVGLVERFRIPRLDQKLGL